MGRERGSIDPHACGGSEPKPQPVTYAHFAAQPDTMIVELHAALNSDVSEIKVWRRARALG